MSFYGFHPLTERWFRSQFDQPTEPQQFGWPSIAAGKNTLIAAPTGSGKTLTAFLSVIDRLMRESLSGELTEETRVIYVSPLRALSNDMHRNLELPLQQISELAAAESSEFVPIRAGLRTGDTSSSQRAALVRRPPHIYVTTPESLYLLLTAEKSREKLRHVETVIIDEIHALVRDKRGSHLALSLERLESLTERPLQRIGLSATQKPIERMAEFLIGEPGDDESKLAVGERCTIVDVGHGRELDLAIETPPSELGAVCMHEQWAEVNQQLVELIESHRSTLIFVNTRRLAERLTHQLSEQLGEESVSSHHGSLSSEIRLTTERKLKAGELKAVVATASLELGLDVGYIDLVIQIGSPRSIATFLQRIGRSGHSLGLIPKGRLFALTRDELAECAALMRAIRAGRLDVVPIPRAPLDVLAQQIVAEVAAQEWNTDELYETFRRAEPYQSLQRSDFDKIIELLSEGLTRSTGRSRVHLHYDRVGGRLRARRGARIAAVTNAGAIPDIGSFRVVAEPDGVVVGTLDEDFAIESMAGDVFLLGNTSWRIQHVRGGDVTVVDAGGAPPTIPFWRGEAPGRTWELSEEVSLLREELDAKLTPEVLAQWPDPEGAESDAPPERVKASEEVEISLPPTPGHEKGELITREKIIAWLADQSGCNLFAAEQLADYCAAQKAAIGLLPTQRRVVFERFFDESGGMQLVVHAPFGGDVNHAWGLAMRKRFCRSFDFELQASADDDGFILSLGPQHSFPIESLFPMLTPQNVQPLLEQAILAVPMFQLRWRWNVTRALLVMRRQGGKKVPPALQRFRADDMLTAVFPKLTGCQENVVGDIELPDNPLVAQSMHDCLTEALDIDKLHEVLARIQEGEIELVARDTREPSPFSYELLNANPYAFLDGGEIQERRARAVSTRRALTVDDVRDLGRLDPAAISQVREEAQPLVRDADELHDLLLGRILLPQADGLAWEEQFSELVEQRRAALATLSSGSQYWVSAERLPALVALFEDASFEPSLIAPDGVRINWSTTDARLAAVQGFVETSGPTTATEIAELLSFSESQVLATLEALEGEGVVLRGRFTPPPSTENEKEGPTGQSAKTEWCHRRLLARIHRLTMQGLRREIQPVPLYVYMRFLFRHHGVLTSDRRAGPSGLFEVIAMLEGFDVPAVCWEQEVLPLRIGGYRSEWLDELCLTGEVGWGRLSVPHSAGSRSRPMTSMTRVAPVSLFLRDDLPWLTDKNLFEAMPALTSPAEHILELLQESGAMFATDLANRAQMLPSQVRETLGELVTRGLVTADGFAGLRQLLAGRGEKSQRRTARIRRGIERRRVPNNVAGRWSIWRQPANSDEEDRNQTIEQWAWLLLRRWGVVCRDILRRESIPVRWFELLSIFRRLEARGEIRGGRFVHGIAGEQFALGETVRKLRTIRDEPLPEAGELVIISAADPLNLVGILTDEPRVPSKTNNRLAWLNGRAVVALEGEKFRVFSDAPEAIADRLRSQWLGLRGENPLNRIETEAISANDSNEQQGDGKKGTKTPKPHRFPNGIPRPIIS